MNTSLSLSGSGFLITSLQLILGQTENVRGRVSKKKRKGREREREKQLKAQSWKSNATIHRVLSMATDTGTISKGDIAISGQYWRGFLHSQEGRRPKTALLRNSCWCFLFLSFDSFFFFFFLLIPNRFQSPVFSSNSLESLELLMPARKHILLRSEEYLCSVSNTNRRRFKYCSSGVCLCGCVRERAGERV